MPSIVWCSRSPLHVAEEIHEVEQLVKANPGWLKLNLVNGAGKRTGEEVLVRTHHISSVWKYFPPKP